MTKVMALETPSGHEADRMSTLPHERKSAPTLLPREKGAWGQVLFPLATGLHLGRASLASAGFAVAALAAFFAHEPLLLLLGGRGARARREAITSAALMIAACSLVGLSALAFAASKLDQEEGWLALPVALSLASLVVLAAGSERTTGGEILAATAMSAWIVPMGASTGRIELALQAWLAYVVAFGVATVAVGGAIDAHKHPGQSRLQAVSRAVVPAALLLTLGAWTAGALPGAAVVGLCPIVVLAMVLAIRGVHPRHLRPVGWSMVVCMAFLALALAWAAG